MLRFLLFVLSCSCMVLSCSTASDPAKPNTPGSLTMQHITDMPFVGGEATSVYVAGNTVLAIINGRIAKVEVSGGAVTMFATPELFTTIAEGSAGELYATDGRALWIAPSLQESFAVSKAYSWNSTTESLNFFIGQNGQPYLQVVQYPSSTLVFTSSDHGITWTRITLPSGGNFSAAADGTLILSSAKGFYTSTDNGTTWSTNPAILANYAPKVLKTSNGTYVAYLPGGGGLWTSSNGTAFTNVNTFNQAPFHSKIVEGGDGFLYSMVQTQGGGTGDRTAQLMRSTDVGATWTHVLFAQGHDVHVSGSTIAVGLGESGCGGLAISNNNGATFVSAGLHAPTEFSNIGLDQHGSLFMMADKGLFKQTTSGWTTLGSMSTFTGFCSTPTGSMVASGTTTSYASSNGGTTWSAVAMPNIPVVGTGYLGTPVVCGLQNGDCIVSLTHYRTDLGKHTNGILARITSGGQITTLANSQNYVWMVQDATGTLYARTDNFVTQRRSNDNGATFTEVSDAAPGFVFTTDNRAINFNGTNGFTISSVGSNNKQALELTGLTGLPWMVTQGIVDKQNKLYLLSSTDGVFVSTKGL